MKSIPRTFLAVGLAAISTTLATSASGAASKPFVGDWKLDPTRSKLIDVMKVGRLNSNKYTFDFGADKPETIVTDGSDQSGVSGTTLSVSVEGPDAWKVVRKKNGRMLITAIGSFPKTAICSPTISTKSPLMEQSPLWTMYIRQRDGDWASRVRG